MEYTIQQEGGQDHHGQQICQVPEEDPIIQHQSKPNQADYMGNGEVEEADPDCRPQSCEPTEKLT